LRLGVELGAELLLPELSRVAGVHLALGRFWLAAFHDFELISRILKLGLRGVTDDEALGI
jgi:hypothetical protein